MTAPTLPPLAPDRPGRYLLRNSHAVTIFIVEKHPNSGEMYAGQAEAIGSCDLMYWRMGAGYTSHGAAPTGYDIVARAHDDKEWCLALARQLAEAHGHKVMPNG